MKRFVPPAGVWSAAVVVVAVGAFAYADRVQLHWYSPAPSTPTLPAAVATLIPDVVVGVVRVCDLVKDNRTGIPTEAAVGEFQKYGCAGMWGTYKLNDRLEVTVRSGPGGSYVVSVDANSQVSLGDAWPPGR